MMDVTVYVPNTGQSLSRLHQAGRVAIASTAGVKVELPWAPAQASLGGYADKWDQVERVGRQPLVRYNSRGLPTLSLDLLLTDPTGTHDRVDYEIYQLRRLGEGAQLITVAGLSVGEEGPWRLNSMSVNIDQRTESNAEVERATVSLELVAAVDIAVTATEKALPKNTGPLTGGSKKPPKTKAPISGASQNYTVKSGDSLWAISDRFYGDPHKWPRIADANNLRNPSLIKPGQRLTIPPRG